MVKRVRRITEGYYKGTNQLPPEGTSFVYYKKQSELVPGDIVNLTSPGSPFGWAVVTKVDESQVYFFRPWMKSDESGYPYIGVEQFSGFRSDRLIEVRP
jgi:hypothetical protein